MAHAERSEYPYGKMIRFGVFDVKLQTATADVKFRIRQVFHSRTTRIST